MLLSAREHPRCAHTCYTARAAKWCNTRTLTLLVAVPAAYMLTGGAVFETRGVAVEAVHKAVDAQRRYCTGTSWRAPCEWERDAAVSSAGVCAGVCVGADVRNVES
jgi:hypothetical protein